MIKKGKRLLFAHNAAFILFCIMGLGFFMAGISPTSFSFAGEWRLRVYAACMTEIFPEEIQENEKKEIVFRNSLSAKWKSDPSENHPG